MHDLAAALDGVDTLTFDCYGTLIDWEAGIREAWRRVFPGLEAEAEKELFDLYLRTEASIQAEGYRSYREVLGLAAQKVAGQLGGGISREAAASLAESLPAWRPFPDTNEALARLGERFRLGVVSNIDNDLFAETARHLAVEFAFVVTAEAVQAYKPAHLHFHRVLNTHAGRDRLLHVAQSLYHDELPCRQLGIRLVWINRRQEQAAADAVPLATFATLTELAEAVDATGA